MTQPLKEAFAHAGDGIVHAFKERNMRIHLIFALAAVILGFVLRIDHAGWLAVVVCIALVFSLETLNTALESIVDLASPDYHDLAKHAKDCAAGAVLIAAIGSLIVACIVYLPAFFALVGA